LQAGGANWRVLGAHETDDKGVRKPVRVLGIDPGFRLTGYGIVDTDGQQSRWIASGVIDARRFDGTAERLAVIHQGVAEQIAEHRPTEMAVERVFVAKNADSALKLGQARAAAICASFGHDTAIAVHEYAAREVKQAIVGRGGAAKEQVAHMVCVLLGIDHDLQADAADALGIALCHAHMRSASRRIAEAMS